MPFLFKNKENGKWISFDKNSSTYGNRNITLTDCPECEENTVSADMPDSVSDEYMIKLNENCILPDDVNNLISGQCSNSDKDIYIMKKLNDSFLNQSLPNALTVSIGFNDNKTASVNSSTYNWGKEITNGTHNYISGETKDNSKIYTVIKDPKIYKNNSEINNPKMQDFLIDNIEIRCKLFHVIEEYNSNKQLVAKTIYRLKYIDKSNIGDLTDNAVVGVFMFIEATEQDLTTYSPQSNDAAILYFGKENYENSSTNEINSVNFSTAYIGTFLSGTMKAGYVNSDEYGGGIIIKDNSSNLKTSFRVIPNDSIFNRMIKYSYTRQGINNSGNDIDLNISSYINPFKKMTVHKNAVISKNHKDGTNLSTTVFNIVPASEPFSLLEGYSNYSITDEINVLNSKLQTNTSFDNIVQQIQKILNLINENNAGDEYAHIVNIYKNDMQNMKYCFTIAKKLYQNITILYNNMINNYSKIGFNNIYGHNGQSGKMIFDDSLANSVVQQLNTLKLEISATKQNFKRQYNLSLIEIEDEVFVFLIDIFKYIKYNYDNIQKHVNAFFDYNDAKQHINYCKTKPFLNQIKVDSNEVFNYDALMNLSTGSLKQRIQHGESLKNKTKTFFDIDFGLIYEQLFVDARTGPKEFDSTRIGKILHKDSSVVSQFMNTNNSQKGIMHYYHDILITQKQYYERFKKLKSQNNVINYFKNNFPNSSAPRVIMQYYSDHGKNLQSGSSYFFSLMTYYSQLMGNTSSDDNAREDEIFLSLFKNLRYYKETGVLIPSLDYSAIKDDNLYKYYENNYFINKKSEPSIISAFMNKYSTLANVIETNNGNHDGIISINDSSLKTSESFANMENFDIQRVSNYHPPKPSIIAASSDGDYNNSLFNDAFYYYSTQDDKHVSLGEYLKADYVGGKFENNQANCSEDDGNNGFNDSNPNIIMSYSCGTTGNSYGGESDTRDINKFFDSDGAACKSSSVYFKHTITLYYKNGNNGKCIVKLVLNNDTDNGLTLSDSIPHTEYLEKFSTSNGVISLTTIYSGPAKSDNKMDYLQDIGNDEPSSSDFVLYNADKDADNRFFRLYVQDNKVKLDYKLSRGLAIDKSKNDANMKGLVDPTISINDSKREKIIYLYKNNKNVGEIINKSVYIDSAGVSHNIDSSKLNTVIQNTGTGEDTSTYAKYTNFCYSGVATANTPSEDSVAKINNIYLDKNEMKYIYHSDGTCVDGTDNASTLNLKKNEFNSNHGACVTDPAVVNMIDISRYNEINSSSNNFTDGKCDKKHIFSGAITKFKNSRNGFRSKFENMINKFNELNENELKILEGTQASIENLKETIKEYNNLHQTATINKSKKTITDAQANDTKILVKNSQYNMALLGIGAIGATMLMFNYMKK
tara:strand:- start:16376 stop:20512 length:4137 start_codon:yes stop_codon:yes gene_type:complete